MLATIPSTTRPAYPRASLEDLLMVIMGASVGSAMFQYGLQRASLSDAMEVFIDLIEARLSR